MVYFGCSQWGYDNWVGDLYPKNSKRSEFLYHYSGIFNTVELNPTFHQPDISAADLKKWSDRTPPHFKFCPKFPREISHDKLLYGAEELTKDFIQNISVFGERLGISFLQLHHDSMPEEFPAIDHYLKSLPEDFKVSVELRPFWLKSDNILAEALGILRNNKAGVVITDNLQTRKYINKLKLTNHTAFVRFIAYGHETDYPRLDDWMKLIEEWNSKGLPEIYFFLHFPSENTDLEFLHYAIEKFDMVSPRKQES
jgi:uncharacterized protein YecE (DUF72 family)